MDNKNKMFFILRRLTIAILSITFIVWGYIVIKSDNIALGVFLIGIALFIIILGSILISRQKNQLDRGEILQDELSTHLLYKTGYINWVSSTLIWVFLGSFIDDLTYPRYGIYLGLLASFVMFPIIYYFVKRSELE